jgi:poly(A) polymerase
LPPDPALAQTVAARLKLSNAQRKRLSLAAEAGEPGEARSLAHAIGLESARDRLLLRGSGEAWARGLEALSGWEPPRFPIGGGALVALGLKAGPLVAATLQAVERRWVEEGFPDEERVRAIALEEVGRTAQRRPT